MRCFSFLISFSEALVFQWLQSSMPHVNFIVWSCLGPAAPKPSAKKFDVRAEGSQTVDTSWKRHFALFAMNFTHIHGNPPYGLAIWQISRFFTKFHGVMFKSIFTYRILSLLKYVPKSTAANFIRICRELAWQGAVPASWRSRFDYKSSCRTIPPRISLN